MKNIAGIIILFISALAPLQGNALAEISGVYTWQTCMETALAHNPDLQSSREAISQKKAIRGITRSVLLPRVTATASGQRSSTTSGAARETADRYYYGVTARQLIFDGLKSVYDLKGADADIASARYEYAEASAKVRLDLRKAFIALLKAQEMLGIAEEIEKRRKHIMELVKMKYEAGSENRGSYYAARADYLQSRADVKSAMREISLSRKTICFLMGMDEPGLFTVKGDLIVEGTYGDTPDFSSLALETPVMKKYMAASSAALHSLRSSKADFSPELYGTGSAGRGGDSPGNMSGSWSVGFEITAPLFSGGETWYGHERAKSQYRQARMQERSARFEAMRSMEESWNDLRDSIDSLEAQKAALEAALERSRIGEARYSIGTLSFDNWTIIESNLSGAKKAWLSACAAALDAEARWIYATGGTLDHEK